MLQDSTRKRLHILIYSDIGNEQTHTQKDKRTSKIFKCAGLSVIWLAFSDLHI